jgi:hypothetical protein
VQQHDDCVTRPDTARNRRMAAMSVFGASRFTAVLAAIALSGTLGTFWWAIETRSDLKAGAANRSAQRALASKPTGRSLRTQDERSGKFELMGRSERPQPSPPGWTEDHDQPPERSAAPSLLVNYANPSLRDGRADMPLPVPPASPPPYLPPHAGEGREGGSQARAPDAPASAAPLPAENPKRQAREPRSEAAAVATPQSPKLPARSYYLEKIVEQGDAGEVKFRYRRQSCEPPNMPDVCFMPQANRRGIVLERR